MTKAEADRIAAAGVEFAYLVQQDMPEGEYRIWDALEDVPCTQATVALEFLKERGCVDVERRRCFPASNCFFEDSLGEWHALAFQCETEME